MSELTNADDNSRIDDSQSPGFHFISNFQSMHDLNERLVLLEYAKEFCAEYKCKPFHRYYFAVQTNPGEQFYAFSCLAAWLIKSKCKFTQTELNPQEYEDPNVTIHAILEALRPLVEHIHFPPNKLKQGYGQEVIWVLNVFAEEALKTSNQTSRATVIVKGLKQDDSSEIERENDDDNEIEMNFDDQYTLVEDPLQDEFDSAGAQLFEQPKSLLLSQTDSSQWNMEVERVMPQLKVVLRSSDHKADWRLHIKDVHSHRKEVDSHFAVTQNALEKLGLEIKRSLDKIENREKYLQLQLEPLINEYNNLNTHLNTVNEKYKTVSGGVTEKSRQLAAISDELDAVKSEMEERGSSMSDSTPLVSLRKALTKVKAESASIDIRIGVALNTLLQVKALHETGPVIAEKTALHQLF